MSSSPVIRGQFWVRARSAQGLASTASEKWAGFITSGAEAVHSTRIAAGETAEPMISKERQPIRFNVHVVDDVKELSTSGGTTVMGSPERWRFGAGGHRFPSIFYEGRLPISAFTAVLFHCIQIRHTFLSGECLAVTRARTFLSDPCVAIDYRNSLRNSDLHHDTHPRPTGGFERRDLFREVYRHQSRLVFAEG